MLGGILSAPALPVHIERARRANDRRAVTSRRRELEHNPGPLSTGPQPTAATCSLPEQLEPAKPAPCEAAPLTRCELAHVLAIGVAVEGAARIHGVTPAQILGRCRAAAITQARAVAWWCLSEIDGLSCAGLARWWRCHHTSILYARRKIDGIISAGKDPKISQWLDLAQRCETFTAKSEP